LLHSTGKSDTQTSKGNLPEELLQQYEEEVGLLDEAMVCSIEHEPDGDEKK
jgi:hypothetical protein